MLGFHGYGHAQRNMAGEAAVARAEEHADRYQRALARVKSKQEAATKMVVRKVLTAGTAAGLGFWQGYKGIPEWFGFGADLWIGGGASLAALFGDELGLSEDVAGYLDSVGTGALAFWGANQGNMYGIKKSEEVSTTGYGGGDPAQFAPNMPHHDQAHSNHQPENAVPYGYR